MIAITHGTNVSLVSTISKKSRKEETALLLQRNLLSMSPMYLGPGADDCNEDHGEGDEVFTESGDEAPSVDDDEISRQLTPATPEPVPSRGGGPGRGSRRGQRASDQWDTATPADKSEGEKSGFYLKFKSERV